MAKLNGLIAPDDLSMMSNGVKKDLLKKQQSKEEKGNWDSKWEFLLSGLSYAVGLGNVWRFPYLVYRNGGGAFFIPYTIMLLFVGLPLFLMELAAGQFSSEGPITVWKMNPLFTGLGYAMFLMSTLVGIYYNIILGWALYFLYSSFTFDSLPWSTCDNPWNTVACRRFDISNCTAQKGRVDGNGTCILNNTVSKSEWEKLAIYNSKMPSDEFFHHGVLGITDGITDMGSLRIPLVICLFICWAIIFVCLVRGVKSMGKVVYFTALFPYVVLTSLLIRALTLPGAADGILFYLKPDWERLKHAAVWADAAMQIFFSLSPCWGGLICLSSYNKFHNNFYIDTIFIAFGNCLTSFYAGFVIFGIVGFMAHELSVPVSEVASQGPGLAFIAYPEAVARFPLAPLWSILFFVMLLTLGLGTQFTMIETVVTTLVDTFPKLRRRKPTILFCIVMFMFLSGVFLCYEGGIYILQLMDNYCASFSALMIGLVEVIAIAWVYGADRFLEDCKLMLGHYPYKRVYWKFIWKYVCPILIVFILGFSLIDIQPVIYGTYKFPHWAPFVGWCLSLTSVSAIPVVMILQILKEQGPIIERIKWLVRPAADFGPKHFRSDNSSDEDCNDDCYRQIQNLKHNRKGKKDIRSLSDKHIDSQIPLASNFDDDEEDEMEFEDVYNNNVSNEQQKRLNKQYSIDYRSDNQSANLKEANGLENKKSSNNKK